MDRDIRLKQFSSSLFSFLYKEYNSTFELPVKLPLLHVDSEEGCSDEEKRAVLKLCLSFRAVFNEVFVKAFPQIQKSVKHFMTFLTSRCLKLCGDDLFLSFVIICAFIAELNLFCCVNGCYAFLSTAPRCLSAIFNRRLKREFYSRGGWERLQLFCENFVHMNGRSCSDHVNGEGASSPNSVQNILHLLEQNSSSDEDTSSSDASSSEEIEEEEESEESTAEENISDDSDDSETSETTMDSEDSELDEDSETESSEEEEEELQPPKTGGIKRTIDCVESDDDETETSEDSEPSSLSEDDSESDSEDDLQSDPSLMPNQVNTITPIMQENLSVEKKIL